VDFELSDDQVALQQELRRFLEARVTSEARRAIGALPGAVDRALWRELAGMGVFAITRPEAEGGVGLGMAEASIVFEELGRAAVPGPLVATFLAAAADLVDGAATGEAVVGVVPADGPVMIEHLDALDAVLVIDDDRVVVGPPPQRLTPVERPLDPLTPVHLLDAPPDGEQVGDAAVASRLLREGSLLTAAVQVGLAAAAVDAGSAYAKQRTQFGKAIGAFQAVKHLLADALVSVEVARAAVHAAAVEIDDGGAAPSRAVDSARIVASASGHRATTACIQVHGGIGYTWELDAHLYLKRVLVLDQLPDTTEDCLDALVARL